MEGFRIRDKLVILVKASMENSQCQVKVQSELSAPLRVKNGLRQGDSLASLLCDTALEKSDKELRYPNEGHSFLYVRADTSFCGRYRHNWKVIGRQRNPLWPLKLQLKQWD
jgi:hypothetical protein